MISDKTALENVFAELAQHIQTKTDIYIIGGAALLHHELKEATKDIDLVVSTKQEFYALTNALASSGFRATTPTPEYTNMNLSDIYVRDDYRIDVFEDTVCAKFRLSESMKRRADHTQTQDDLRVHVCASQDILLFKTMTQREGDITDCVAIARASPNWKSVLEELKHQARTHGQDVWITWVAQRLELLAERGVQIPIMNDIHELVKDYYQQLEEQLSE